MNFVEKNVSTNLLKNLRFNLRVINGIASAGFTLIELLIIISIIAILAAMLLPALKKAKSTSIKIACQSNLKQAGQGIYMYTQDWNEYGPSRSVNVGGCYWMLQLSTYLGGPEASTLSDDGRDDNAADKKIPIFQCPESWNKAPAMWSGHSYGANRNLVADRSNVAPDYKTPVKLNDKPFMKYAPNFVLASDCYTYRPSSTTHFNMSIVPTAYYNGLQHHDKGLNILFGDSHVKYHRPQEGNKFLFVTRKNGNELWYTWTP